MNDFSEDAVLGGRLMLRQPKRGHRFGHDAILLAAACPARRGDHVLDLGAGVGAAGLALAKRVAGISVTLVEIDPQLAATAQVNAQRNGFSASIRTVALDVTGSRRAFAKAELVPGSAMHVLMNPPFHDEISRQASPAPERANINYYTPTNSPQIAYLFTKLFWRAMACNGYRMADSGVDWHAL